MEPVNLTCIECGGELPDNPAILTLPVEYRFCLDCYRKKYRPKVPPHMHGPDMALESELPKLGLWARIRVPHKEAANLEGILPKDTEGHIFIKGRKFDQDNIPNGKITLGIVLMDPETSNIYYQVGCEHNCGYVLRDEVKPGTLKYLIQNKWLEFPE